MESKEESDDSPREVRIRHSWHADDVDLEENSNSVANFWAMFSLESNPWSPPDPSEIGLIHHKFPVDYIFGCTYLYFYSILFSLIFLVIINIKYYPFHIILAFIISASTFLLCILIFFSFSPLILEYFWEC